MANSQLPLNDTDFWWLRYFLGIAVPIGLFIWGLYSLVTMHSYTVWWLGRGRLNFVPVGGQQAVLMGIAYLGVAVALFAKCYAQYHERMGYFYQWILAPGMLLAGGGVVWCSWIFLAR